MIPQPVSALVAGLRSRGVEVDVGVPGDPLVTSVCVDSREAGPGTLFVALPGSRVDGHDFAAAALAGGAVAALVSRPVAGPHLRVGDTLRGLGELAGHVRDALPARVVGITGSVGKTTTKDLLADLLAAAGPTVAPPGSFNNDIGTPLTVLRAEAATRFLVLEMGARAPGDIARLAALARPHGGVVLSVGSAHLGVFGSREAIAAAKAELVGAATDYVVLNLDDPLVAAMAPRARGRVVTVSASGAPDADVAATGVRLGAHGGASFQLRLGGERHPVELSLVGEHQVGNALAAAAAAHAEGLSPAAVAAGLGAARPRSRWRMETTVSPEGVTVVNDAYNANPESVRAALQALAALVRARPGARGFAVLGAMHELGPASVQAHEAVGRLAARLDLRVVAVGAGAAAVHAGALREGSWDREPVQVPDADAALALLRAQLRPGDVVLVKASRAEGLERVALALAAGT